MKTLETITAFSTIFFSVLISNFATAATINPDFNSLPSNQGWSFVKSTTGSHANDTEAGTFSVNGSTLNVSTMGTGLVSPSGLGYQQAGIVNPDHDWTLSWTMKVNAYEQGSSDNNYGIWFGVYNGVSVVGVALSDSELSVYQSGTATGTGWTSSNRYGATSIDKAFNTTNTFHTYALSYTAIGTTGFGDFVFSIDGNNTLTGSSIASSADYLTFGDGTGDANASWQLSDYNFEQNISFVPLPATLLLLGSGLTLLTGKKKHNKVI